MYWRSLQDKPDKAGNYITDVGRCYFQGGVWKNPRHYRPSKWLDEKNEPWVDVEDQLPDIGFPLFLFINEPAKRLAVITGGVYDIETGFSLITPPVTIKSPVTHWMYQFAPPTSFVLDLKADAIKEILGMESTNKDSNGVKEILPAEISEGGYVTVIDELHDADHANALIGKKFPNLPNIQE